MPLTCDEVSRRALAAKIKIDRMMQSDDRPRFPSGNLVRVETLVVWRDWVRSINESLVAAEHGWYRAVEALGLVPSDLPKGHPARDPWAMNAPGCARIALLDLEKRINSLTYSSDRIEGPPCPQNRS